MFLFLFLILDLKKSFFLSYSVSRNATLSSNKKTLEVNLPFKLDYNNIKVEFGDS